MNKSIFDRFFTDLFNKRSIIDSRLQAFSRFVQAALTANNPGGVFNSILATLIAAHNAYFDNLKDHRTQLALRKGGTSTLDSVVSQFIDAVRSKYNAIAAAFPEGTAAYQEFFPKGLSEFSRLTRTNVLSVAHTFAITADKYKAQLGGKPFADMFASFETDITAALANQNTGKAAVQTASSDLQSNRQPVEIALMKSMYLVGSQFAPDWNKCSSYFDFSLLFGDHHSSGATTQGKVAAHSTTVCVSNDIDAMSIFTLKNNSDMPLSFYMAHEQGGSMKGHAIEVAAHSQHVSPFAEFAAADGLFVYVKNDSEFEGTWEVRVE